MSSELSLQTEKATAPSSGRRRFLSLLSMALGACGAAIVGIPIAGFLLAPFFRKRMEIWRAVGRADQFKIDSTVEVTFQDASPLPWAGVTAQTGAWLRRVSGQEFIAFSINCSHLGCPVRWVPDAGIFMCPCHGGVYYRDGTVAAGPPPKPLSQYPVRVRNGQVEVKTGPIPIV